MSRPSKRPRLHFLPSVSPDPDGELTAARARNDGLLKTRWEQIFTRYERDFDGVGDEISMLDDTIVVDNGHIRSMRNARDTGTAGIVEHIIESPSKYDGRQLLRAMTVAPSENSEDSVSDNDADEVLNSIETIADAIITDGESSEDELFNVYSTQESLQYRKPALSRGEHGEARGLKYESDVDSLFDNRPIMRSPSVDDLFDTTSPVDPRSHFVPTSRWSRPNNDVSETPDTSLGSLPPRETINREFIREEIRKAIEEENQIQESKIDPIWRIPVRLTSGTMSTPITVAASSKTEQLATEASDDDADDEHEVDSVWKIEHRTRRSKREVAAERSLKRIRAESEDPLQDGFTSDIEQPYYMVQNERMRAESKSKHSDESVSDRERDLPIQQQRTMTPADQTRAVRSSRSASTSLIQPKKATPPGRPLPKSKPKPRSRSTSNPSQVIVHVPLPRPTMAKRKRKSNG